MKFFLQRVYSLTLVALQLGALIYLVLTGPIIARDMPLFLLQLVGVLIALAALWRMSGTHWRILPDPHPRGRLITSGIYRRIRHPMYASVLLIAAVWVMILPQPDRALAWLLLFLVLWLKMRMEEHLLEARFGDKYRRYCNATHRLLPSVM